MKESRGTAVGDGGASSCHDSLGGKKRTWRATRPPGLKSCCLQSLSGAWRSVVDSRGDRDTLEQDQMKGLPSLSCEELLTSLKRGDMEDVILRRPTLRRV